MSERTIYPLKSEVGNVSPRILGVLEYHIAGQQADIERGDHIPPGIESRKKILSWYQDTNHFKEVYSKATEFYSAHQTNAEIRRFNGRLAGDMFQHIAHSYTSGRLDEGDIALSPNRTLGVIKAALSEANLQKAKYKWTSLEKLKIPNGLVVDLKRKEVKKICKYTINKKGEIIKKHIETVRRLRKRNSELFGKGQALFVLLGPDTDIFNQSDASVIVLPFDRYQFGDFINEVIYKFRGIPSFDDDHHSATNATLYDIQRRIRKQKKRGLKYAEFDGEKLQFEEFVRILESEKNLSELFD